MRAAFTDRFAAACVHSKFLWIKWERQTTDGAVAEIAAFWLPKQKFVTHLSHPFFTSSFMLWPMIIFLTLNAAIYRTDLQAAHVFYFFAYGFMVPYHHTPRVVACCAGPAGRKRKLTL
jgi:hypothetical protein